MNVNEAVRIHLAALEAGRSNFEDTLALIDRYFDYQPTAFHNGPLSNAAGENAGSCRVFALGRHCNLNESETLRLFAQHYDQVLADPAGDSHGNIRQFISTGWSGIRFDGEPLRSHTAPITREEETRS
ncbi:HopJ type III effector protein [Marinobacter pelagius]|uniref:HopJ type III effector protein n=1 Tax=Marinobacter sp. C7 TaxID=2951363 RepID=UPI001EEFAE9C|nr:HopJ type III effector protein [Marinobacter sp. C7]MCG7201082.1 HopJ type III effector protein [Marinobacter sp. C7]